MKAQDYLESLKAGCRHFSYLVQIAQLPRRAFAGDPDQPKANKRALPLHIQEEAEKVMDEHGQSLTDEQREAFWKHIERMEASQVSDLEWPQIIHQRFMANVPDEARNTLRGKDIAVGLLRDASFNGSALKVPDSKNCWVIAMNEGYSTIIYSFARTLASTFKMRPSNGGEETLPTLRLKTPPPRCLIC